MSAGIADPSMTKSKMDYSAGKDVLSTSRAYTEFFGEIGGQNKSFKNTSNGGATVTNRTFDNTSFKSFGGQAQTFNPQSPFTPTQNLNLKEQIKAGTNVGFYGPGKYDYYVATDEVQNKLQKFVPYGLSKEGAPVVNEAAAQALAEKDLAEGKSLELEQQKNRDLTSKRTKLEAARTNTGAKRAGQSTILTGASEQPAGTVLGGSSKTLLGM